ncbi:MAG: hypothetical protein GY791_15995 [Alphaproteobacteria bacterium]|nr:hypothetical protein [Alphaproteobacteria bacterium]
MNKRGWFLLVFAALFATLAVLGYLYPVSSPDGWFERRTEERIQNR